MKSEIIEPIIAPQIPIKAKGTASFQFINFLLVYITTEKIAGSMKNIRFIPCAVEFQEIRSDRLLKLRLRPFRVRQKFLRLFQKSLL